jgi:hypothetical protein
VISLPRPTIAVLGVLLILAGCSSPDVAPTVATPPPTKTPANQVSLPVEAALLAPSFGSDWIVVGLAAPQSIALEDPSVAIRLLDRSGKEIERRTVELPFDSLLPGSAWPFREVFRPAASPSAVEATLEGTGRASGAAPRLRGEVLTTFIDSQGTRAALGSITNRAGESVRLDRVALLGRDSAGALQEVAAAVPAASVLPAGEVTPLLAQLPDGGDLLDWEVLPIASTGAFSPAAVEVGEIYAAEDDQSNPFVTASVRNTAQGQRWISLTAVAQVGSTWLVGDSITAPLPVAQGEGLPLTIRVPGSELPPDEEIEWLLFPDATAAETGTVPLTAEVVGFSPLGSSLLLRVRISGGATPVRLPAAHAWVATDEGQTVSAASAIGPEVLLPGQEAVVTLALPVPRGLELALAQVEVRAAGLP